MNTAALRVFAGNVARRLFDIRGKRRQVRPAQVLLSEAQIAELVELGYRKGFAMGVEAGRKETQERMGKALGLRP